MTIDATAVAEGLLATVPFARTIGTRFTEITVAADGVRAVAELPDDPAVHNHVGGPHAGAMFTLAETASGAIVLAAFGDQLHRATPLAVHAGIAYKKLAMGVVSATATLSRPAADVVAELDAGQRPEFEVNVVIANAEGVTTGEMTITWTLRPHR
ncbi:DUF4442 domain-containing protein [Catellatospora citrea]|uniref:DUF4442 domain-containing protein n=1 Tax=Catellatospora citrea TaxID=53366 RepID=A0A8J3P147_9ACTN|nr:DUF4442 domain-containing protein [Catellatospora citrea]RKE09254.1 uncharacterized protein DUF4442 [Catellatospora citrea]GIF99566.1 DUF4442 domain-containing protein [Catellatospora citrea]